MKKANNCTREEKANDAGWARDLTSLTHTLNNSLSCHSFLEV